MKKEELKREDGRYLIYYWFDDERDASERRRDQSVRENKPAAKGGERPQAE